MKNIFLILKENKWKIISSFVLALIISSFPSFLKLYLGEEFGEHHTISIILFGIFLIGYFTLIYLIGSLKENFFSFLGFLQVIGIVSLLILILIYTLQKIILI